MGSSRPDKLLQAMFCGACAAAPLHAQFVNRATWLGREQEETRRDFVQGSEYYLDRFSYVVVPPWWDRGLLRFCDQAHYRVGSVSRSAFTIEGGFDTTIELGDGVDFRYHMLQGENRDTRFLRNAVEFEHALGTQTAVFVQGEILDDKSLIDASLGAWLWRRDDSALRIMWTAVDLPSRQSQRVAYERDAYAVMLTGAFGDPERHRVAFELGGQLPFELNDVDADETVELQRWIGSVESHVRVGERDWLAGGLEIEWTDKSFTPGVTSNALAEDFRRDFHQVRLEWWRDDARVPWSAGFMHTRLDEDGIVSAEPSGNLRVRRDEWFGVGRLQVPLTDRLAFEPQIFAGTVRQAFRDGTSDRRVDRFEGKIACNARWDFSPNATLALVVTMQLDELAFGGGGVQFVARF